MLSDAEHKLRRKAQNRQYYLTTREKMRAQRKAWQIANREKVRAYSRKYYLANPEKARAQDRAWKKANREKLLARKRQYYLTHREKIRAYYLANREKMLTRDKAWQQAHPEKCRNNGQRRRARRLGLPNTLTVSEWQAICAAYKYRCAYCGKKAKLTQDHVMPLSKGGGTVATNTVPACLSCNCSKSTRPPIKPINLPMGI